jgi:hypothetical protein
MHVASGSQQRSSEVHASSTQFGPSPLEDPSVAPVDGELESADEVDAGSV